MRGHGFCFTDGFSMTAEMPLCRSDQSKAERPGPLLVAHRPGTLGSSPRWTGLLCPPHPKTFTVWGGQRIARAPALGILDLRWEVQWSWRERPDDWDRSHGRDDAERPSSQTCLSPLMWRSLRAPSAIGDASSKPAPV